MPKKKLTLFVHSFKEPLLVTFSIVLYGLALLIHMNTIAFLFILFAIIVGSYRLFWELYQSIKHGHYALDYIAALAIIVSFISSEYLVSAIIALMISSGKNLEEYGVSEAKKSLTLLAKRIPQDVHLFEHGQAGKKIALHNVTINSHIFIRKGEIIPLDGELVSETGQTDESSLTGEPYFIEKIKGDLVRSGTVNVGEPIVINVTKVEKDSTYRKIIDMVKKAQNEKAPLVRLADRYSTYFTIITFCIAIMGYFFGGGLRGILAVLVIATPCPLILATPIALLGGMNAAAKQRIIIKKLSSLEILSRVTTMVFDKTGTITIGKPSVTEIILHNNEHTVKEVLAIALTLERNSLHPIAKAIVQYAQEQHIHPLTATNIKETIGNGIEASIHGVTYLIHKSKHENTEGIAIDLVADSKILATIQLEDTIKDSSKVSILELAKKHIDLHIFTGDKETEAKRIADLLGSSVKVEAEMTPDQKRLGIEALQKKENTVAMLGDGINDAPALAKADVGIVFSNEEQTAASEAADVVLLGGNFSLVEKTLVIAKRTIAIALQSIRWGIGLSIVGMLFASFGLIPPLVGAGLQELIDVAVIINALRASRV